MDPSFWNCCRVHTKSQSTQRGLERGLSTLQSPNKQNLLIELTPASAIASSSSQTAPSLSDLGFPAEQTQGDVKGQALLDKRTHKLKVHQKLGLIAAARDLTQVLPFT